MAPQMNAHFELLSKHCLLPDGMQYDYFLKVEDVSMWYAPLISLLNLQKHAAAGWGSSTKFWPGNAGGCFMTSPGMSCEDMFKAKAAGASQPAEGDQSKAVAWVAKQTAGKERNLHADSKLAQYVLQDGSVRLKTSVLVVSCRVVGSVAGSTRSG